MTTVVTGQRYDGEVGLNHFSDMAIIRLELPDGPFIIFAKTVIRNFDGDGQNAAARLVNNEADLDRVDIRISGNGNAQWAAQEVSLQATLVIGPESPDRIVDLRAQTWNGAAFQSSIYAIQVDVVNE
jgi:hypothetical protein